MSNMPLVVLVSGSGSNLQVLIDGAAAGTLPVDIRAVVSDRADARALERADRAGIARHVCDPGQHADRRAYANALARHVDTHKPGLIVLAGFMRILHADFLDYFNNRVINLHPSLLPRYRGLDTHRRVLDNGDRLHGASVHFATAKLDAGPVIIQGTVDVAPTDTPASLEQKVHGVEHRILPRAVRWFAEGRLSVDAGRVLLDGRQRPEQGLVRQSYSTQRASTQTL